VGPGAAGSPSSATLHMAVVAADDDRPNHHWELLEYTSEQDAVNTAELPKTNAICEHLVGNLRATVINVHRQQIRRKPGLT
jgi:hypothetical protein